jgi:hypothetical protein
MEIEVREYVRAKNGNIRKIDKIEKCKSCKENLYINIETIKNLYFTNSYHLEDITKHSKNIIDLIEDKEIVEIEYYVKRRAKRITRVFEVEKIDNKLVFLNHRCSFMYDLSENKWIDGKGYNPKIKTILTHEQFEQNAYRLEETDG